MFVTGATYFNGIFFFTDYTMSTRVVINYLNINKSWELVVLFCASRFISVGRIIDVLNFLKINTTFGNMVFLK